MNTGKYLMLGVVAWGLLSGSGRAQTFYGSDNFNDNAFESGRYGAAFTSNGGLWTETGGRLEYTADATSTAINSTNRAVQIVRWANSTSGNTSYADSWTASATVTIDSSAVAANGVALVGMQFTVAGTSTSDYYGVYLMYASSGGRIFSEQALWGGTSFTTTTLGSTGNLNPSFDATDVLLTVNYDGSSHSFTTSYSFDGGTTSFDFTTGGGTGNFGGGATMNTSAWSAEPVGGFGAQFYGGLYGNGVNAGSTLISGQAYLDNFSVSAVPEPSTYAMIAGLVMLGVAAYRRKRVRSV